MNKPFKPSEDIEAIMLAAREQELSEQSANDDFSADITATDLAPTDDDFKDLKNPKTLVARSRDRLQRILDGRTLQKAAAEKRIALAGERCNERQVAAQRAYDEEKAAALAEHVAALADAEGDLSQISACKEAIDLAVGRLNKA